jgi:hypothetical protein
MNRRLPKIVRSTIAAATLTFIGAQAQGATITLQPSTPSAAPGSTLTVDLVLTEGADLPTFGVTELITLEYILNFDTTRLDFVSAVAGPWFAQSGGQDTGFTSVIESPTSVSATFLKTIAAAIVDGMRLSTVTFFVLPSASAGIANLDTSLFRLNETEVTNTLPSAEVSVVPLPAALWLFASALGLLFARSRTRRA